MFIESLHYSCKSIQIIGKKLTEERNVLPISVSKDNIKCRDFDIDAVVFTSVPKSQVKSIEVKQCEKTWLEVMEMV